MRKCGSGKRVVGDASSDRPAWHVLLVLVLLAGAFSPTGIGAVRRVDFKESPESAELAERARLVGDEVYPKVLELFADRTAKLPAKFDIKFKREISPPDAEEFADVVGYVKGSKGTVVFLNGAWFVEHPKNLEAMLVHEMAHVAQRYSSAAPSYWREGIADYVCFKLSYTNGTKCAECSNLSWHYRSGYSCAAAFLLYVEATYGWKVIHELNTQLRGKSYSDAFFATATGRSLSELWAEFKKTPAFTPGASAANKFFESLGYANGVPPKSGDVLTRIRKLPGGEMTLEAGRFLYGLAKRRQLPGFRKGESGNVVFALAVSGEAPSDAYPVCRLFDSSIQGAPSVYHYLVVRASMHSAWRLQRAWRTDRDGLVIEEVAIPAGTK